MGLIPQSVELVFDKFLDRLVKWTGKMRLSPNILSTIGLVPSIVASIFLAKGFFVGAGVFILLGGLLDMMDGKLARMTNRVSKFGALYDSTLDRFAEIAMYTGLGYYFVFQGMHFASLLVVVAASGSIMVSYVRARAESHGFKCKSGWLRRGERIVILGGASLLSFFPQPFDAALIASTRLLPFDIMYHYPPMPLTLAVLFIAMFTPLTVAQRIYEVYQQSRNTGFIEMTNDKSELHSNNKNFERVEI